MIHELHLDTAYLKKIFSKFQEKKICIIGDVMLDRYWIGNVCRISPEAPVPVVELQQQYDALGGAANVALNLTRMGARAFLLSTIGQDDSAMRFLELLKETGIDSGFVVRDNSRPTTSKLRVIAQHQQIVRVDHELSSPIDARISGKLEEHFEKLVAECDAVIVSDYRKGVIIPPLMRFIIERSRQLDKWVSIDPKNADFSLYQGAQILTPNQRELGLPYHIQPQTIEEIVQLSHRLMEDYRLTAVLVTRGEQGMVLIEQNREIVNLPTVAQEVFDVSGAGDTVVAMFTLAKAAGCSHLEAAVLANYAAGIVVAKLGTATLSPNELWQAISAGEGY